MMSPIGVRLRLSNGSFESAHLRRCNQQQKRVEILIVVEHLSNRQRAWGWTTGVAGEHPANRKVVVGAGVRFGGQPRSQQEELGVASQCQVAYL